MLDTINYPNKIIQREEINYRLGIKSSLSDLRSVFGLLYTIYLASDKASHISYASEELVEGKNVITIKDDLYREIENLLNINENQEVFRSIINNNGLLKSQIESLQMALETYWRVAKISFTVNPQNNTVERTGGHRYSKEIFYSTNMVILDCCLLDIDFKPSKDLVELLYCWIVKDEEYLQLNPRLKELSERVELLLTIFSEETQFKIRLDQNKSESNLELIFQQEGIYERLIENEYVHSNDAKEAVGSFRILKSATREKFHYFIKDESKGFSLKEDVKHSEFKDYLGKLKNYLDLIPKRTVVYKEPEINYQVSEITANYSISNSNPKKSYQIIYYGAPGTGKSYTVKEKLASVPKENTATVTFHPEYDYSSFVGGYKPITEKDENGNEDIRYKFVPQVFTNLYVKAWLNSDKQFYLVIEEINRGNCAEIFGDIFQLLDQNQDYTVSPSNELENYLLNKLPPKSDGIVNGLKMPPNLSILATMNTSDQSLFPMDSAFKRRWDWEYIPINYDRTGDNKSSKFRVIIDEDEYFYWLDFIERVNEIIKNNPNLGMDKCIGNYFVNPDSDIITLKAFINKAIFYLWNDVFKDEFGDESIFNENISYEDFFPIGTNGKNQVKAILKNLEINTHKATEVIEDEDTD